ncbi:hypothetical protein DIPPA_33242 [Diplonema papillatum]|nr:hypothetical protein DIPPA_33242 [Diplonema papillatum]
MEEAKQPEAAPAPPAQRHRGILKDEDFDRLFTSSLKKAAEKWTKVPGVVMYDLPPGEFKSLLNHRVSLIDIGTEMKVPGVDAWEELSCRYIFQEGRLLNHESKTGWEVSNQCRQPHPVSWILMNILQRPEGIGELNTNYDDIQVTWNKYLPNKHYCPKHKDWLGLTNICYVMWGAPAMFSFHHSSPPNGLVQQMQLKDKVLLLTGPARSEYMHAVQAVKGRLPRYSARFANISEHVHDLQQRKRTSVKVVDSALEDDNRARWKTSNTKRSVKQSAAFALRAAVSAACDAAVKRQDFDRAILLSPLKLLLSMIEQLKQDALAKHDHETFTSLLDLQEQHTDIDPAAPPAVVQHYLRKLFDALPSTVGAQRSGAVKDLRLKIERIETEQKAHAPEAAVKEEPASDAEQNPVQDEGEQDAAPESEETQEKQAKRRRLKTPGKARNVR